MMVMNTLINKLLREKLPLIRIYNGTQAEFDKFYFHCDFSHKINVTVNEKPRIAIKTHREYELISYVSISFRDMRIIYVEKSYFLIIYLKMYFFGQIYFLNTCFSYI